MRLIRLSLVTIPLALAATPAFADDAVSPAAPFPNLATLDRTTDHSSVNGSLALSFFGDGGPDLGARVDLGGQYVTPSGIGGYASLPISQLRGDDDSQTEIGNLEIGGVYVAPAGPTTDIVIRGGLVLPTGPDDFDFLIGYAAAIPRMTDLVSVAPDTTWLRLGASPLHRAGMFFARADLGLDIVIDQPDDSDVDPLFHVNLAAGVQTGNLTVAGELDTLGTTGDVADGEDRFLHTLAVSVGMEGGRVRPYGALILPLGNELADDFLDMSIAVMAGIEMPIATR
jgi:hypothetical protein